MRDVLGPLLAWRAEGHRAALALVVETWGSSPRPVGSAMAIREDGLIVGSVSAGCVESAVVEAASTASRPVDLVFDRISDESAWSVGLSCGGRLRVWIDPAILDRDFDGFAKRALGGDRAVTTIDLETGAWGAKDGFELVVEPHPRLVIVGAGHLAIALNRIGRAAGFETIVVDPRATFAREDRFDVAPSRLVVAWPAEAFTEIALGSRDYVAVVTHDPKIDEPALELALRSLAAYVGALGSRKTQAQRREALRERGLSEADVERVHGPIGLDLGAKTPDEIAISILAEVVQVRRRAR